MQWVVGNGPNGHDAMRTDEGGDVELCTENHSGNNLMVAHPR